MASYQHIEPKSDSVQSGSDSMPDELVRHCYSMFVLGIGKKRRLSWFVADY